ncbi:MAG TPA: magnesium/cobalt transporter CorA [Dermatophilaceae bacterium]|nr:magnesium/cobalt transporter CorA [Dermatophilaceae bacterium]
MIVDVAVYCGGVRRPCGDLSDELAALRAGSGTGDFLWIGLKDPTRAEFAQVDSELGLHPLAIEDAIKGGQRGKIEAYDGSLFVVLKTLRYLDSTSDIETGEVNVFVGDHFVVTVRSGELSPLAGLRRQLEEDPGLLRLGPYAVLHAIVDDVVDTYGDIDREVARDIEQMEESVFTGEGADANAIYRLKREVLEFRRAALPITTAVSMLHTSPHSPVRDKELRHLFRDVSDHLNAVVDHVESYDRLLTDMLGAHLTQVSVRQNEDMRKISAYVAMAAVPTMIAGIYGMNFEHMPELESSWGYPAVLALMAAVVGALYLTFKRHRWL